MTRTRWLLALLLLTAAACGPRFDSETVAGGTGTGSGSGFIDDGLGGVVAGDATGSGDGSVGDGSAVDGAGSTTGGIGGSGTAGGGTGGAPGGSGTGGTGGGGGTAGSSGPGPAPGVSDAEIKVGYLLPLTGAAPVPSDFESGVNVYWNEINAKGGVGGRKVKVIVEDTQSSATVGRDKAKKLIEQDKVFTIVVLDRLENQEAIGRYLNGRQFPSIEIQTPANLPADQVWQFGVTIDHAVQGRLVADYMVKVLKATKLAIVYENTPALYPGRDAFAAEAAKLGATVSYSKAIDGQGNDFSNEALGLQQSGATTAWLYMAPTPAAKLANQADAAGYHPIWFANSISWGFDLIFKVGPKALANARAFSPWLPLSDARTGAYQAAYRRQNPNKDPDDLGIVGWGVGQIVAEGLKRAQPLGHNTFRDAMQNMKFAPDIWAPLSFGPGVREGANVVAVLKESGGRWTLERDFTGAF